MCGRYALSATAAELIEHFKLLACPEFPPRLNIAPQSTIPVIRQKPGAGRVGQLVRWGLIPSWAEDPSIGNKLNNARGETVAEKPAFRSSFAKHRCLIPASGFYEWQPVAEAGKSGSNPTTSTRPPPVASLRSPAYWPHGHRQPAIQSSRPASSRPDRTRSWRRFTTACRSSCSRNSSTLGSTPRTTTRPR